MRMEPKLHCLEGPGQTTTGMFPFNQTTQTADWAFVKLCWRMQHLLQSFSAKCAYVVCPSVNKQNKYVCVKKDIWFAREY